MSILELKQQFASAIASEEPENIEQVLKSFDKFCRQSVEAEQDPAAKKELIEQLVIVQKSWNSEILQLKAKVRGNIADIKSNGKKINKYLTSF